MIIYMTYGEDITIQKKVWEHDSTRDKDNKNKTRKVF